MHSLKLLSGKYSTQEPLEMAKKTMTNYICTSVLEINAD